MEKLNLQPLDAAHFRPESPNHHKRAYCVQQGIKSRRGTHCQESRHLRGEQSVKRGNAWSVGGTHCQEEGHNLTVKRRDTLQMSKVEIPCQEEGYFVKRSAYNGTMHPRSTQDRWYRSSSTARPARGTPSSRDGGLVRIERRTRTRPSKCEQDKSAEYDWESTLRGYQIWRLQEY